MLLTALVNTQQALADDKPNYEPMEVCVSIELTSNTTDLCDATHIVSIDCSIQTAYITYTCLCNA